jgi:hypothetical protein
LAGVSSFEDEERREMRKLTILNVVVALPLGL